MKSILPKAKKQVSAYKRSKPFAVDMYHCHFQLVITNNLSEYMKKFHDTNWTDAMGCCVSYGNSAEVVLCVREGLTYDTVCHELSHLAQFIMRHTGIIGDSKNQEAEAYLTGYCGGLILKTLARWGVPLK